MLYPEEYGGSGMSRRYLAYTILCEELSRGHMGFASIVCMHASTATHTIASWGTEALRQRYLVPAIRGEMVGAFAITEPNAGSDAAVDPYARHALAGGWRLTGTKMFTSNGTDRRLHHRRRDHRPAVGAQRASSCSWSIRTATAFSVSRRLEKFNIHGADTAELVLDDVFVPDECLLGGDQGGFPQCLSGIDGRPHLHRGARARQWPRRLRGRAAYAKERVQFGQPIGKFQAVQFKLVDMLAKLEQARLFTYHAAVLADHGAPITTEAALAKMVAAESCNEVCQTASTSSAATD